MTFNKVSNLTSGLSAAQAQKSSKSGSDFQGLLRYEGDNLYQLHKSGCIKEALSMICLTVDEKESNDNQNLFEIVRRYAQKRRQIF